MWVDPLVKSKDDGVGNFVSQTLTGSVDYANGELEFVPDLTVQIPKPSFSTVMMGIRTVLENGVRKQYEFARNIFQRFVYIPAPATFPIDESGYVIVRYRADNTTNAIVDEEYNISGINFDLTTNYNESIVPGSIRFTLGGLIYSDIAGELYHSINAGTGVGINAGTVDYNSGMVSITNYATGQSNVVSLQSLLTQLNVQLVDEITFRTPGSPIRPSSLYVQCVKNDGTLLSGTFDSSGYLSVAGMDGFVDYQTGIVQIAFGDWFSASGHEGEDWFIEENVTLDGKIFKPALIYPNTVKFNCVVYTYLPLDSEILGLDPVRLPFDGKVVIFKKGDTVVVHNTKTTVCSNPLTPGSVVDCGRQRIASAEVRDSLGVIVDPNLYEDDLDLGLITFDDPLDLSAYTQPLTVYHTIEDMSLCVDVEINGRLSLNKPVSHDYSKTDSYVSSSLIMKIDGEDLFARWTNPFSQQTWTNAWSDSLIGNSITAQYNYNLDPLELTNKRNNKTKMGLNLYQFHNLQHCWRNTWTDWNRHYQRGLSAH